jgi:hypothetical protein
VRLLVPAFFLLFHLAVLTQLAKERFGIPFNAAPGEAPGFVNPASDPAPQRWDRLIVSRWDAQHYITLALRGYEYCAKKSELGPDRPPDKDVVCQLNFFPGYAFLGGAVSRLLRVPADYALLGISLAASFFGMFLWTSREMVAAMGVSRAYLSLLFFNVFSTGYSLVTVQTEPCAFFCTIASFVLLERRRYALGAFVAGAASIIRPTGVASGLGFAIALLVATLHERRSVIACVKRLPWMVLAGWGLFALAAFFKLRFDDMFVYSHARTRWYHYEPSFTSLLSIKPEWISQSIWAAPNESVWLAAGLLWFTLGHRAAMRGFTLQGQVYWYAVFILNVGISMVSQVELSFSGLSRYMLLALPVFFAMASSMRGNVFAIVTWCALSFVHYWSVGSCFYLGYGRDIGSICHVK